MAWHKIQCWKHCKTALQNSPTPTTAAKKQPHPTYCCEETAPPTTQCILNCCSNSPPLSSASQPSQRSSPLHCCKTAQAPAKRAASSAMVKQNWHASQSRGLGLGTQNLPQNEPWTILKPAWSQRNSSSAEHSCMAGLTLIYTCYFSWYNNCLLNLIVCLMPEGSLWLVRYDFAVSALWLSAVHYAAYCTWQQRSNEI